MGIAKFTTINLEHSTLELAASYGLCKRANQEFLPRGPGWPTKSYQRELRRCPSREVIKWRVTRQFLKRAGPCAFIKRLACDYSVAELLAGSLQTEWASGLSPSNRSVPYAPAPGLLEKIRGSHLRTAWQLGERGHLFR